MGWTNSSVNELEIGQFPTRIVLSTELPAELVAHYGTDIKSGILFYWAADEYLYMIVTSDDTPPVPDQQIKFGAFNGSTFTELLWLNSNVNVGVEIPSDVGQQLYMPSGTSGESFLFLNSGVSLLFTPWNNTSPTAHSLYVNAAGQLRYQGGVTNTLVAPN